MTSLVTLPLCNQTVFTLLNLVTLCNVGFLAHLVIIVWEPPHGFRANICFDPKSSYPTHTYLPPLVN
ncbi:hypothetical protein HanIR_Chr07g0332931 [Helianthus annuus]|nr:hypothetical protein HanIR_Chr07g0332931 [Helianthus annuus]